MKKVMKTVLTCIITLGMIFGSFTAINAKGDGSSQIEQLITYYLSYQEAATTDIQRVLEELKEIDEQKGEAWEKIINYWMYVNNDMTVNKDVALDGLANDDRLCFVVLGFALNDDGSMKDELIGRLRVALESAQKYPNAYIACTGGGTAKENAEATEADQMAQWLVDQGVDEDRVIVENNSKNTVQNAQFTYAILRESYPMIDSLVMITSDYHIPRGCVLYNSQLILSAYEANDKLLNIVSNAGYDAGHDGYESLALQATGVCQIANLNELGNAIRTNTYSVPELSVLEGLTVEQEQYYEVGNALKLNVYAHYDNGYTKNVTEFASMTGYDTDKIGIQTVTISYSENGVTKNLDIKVEVKEKEKVTVPSEELPKETVQKPEKAGSVPTGDTTSFFAWLSMAILAAGTIWIMHRKAINEKM